MRALARRAFIVGLLMMSALTWAQQRELKPGWNLFSKAQDIQLGKEYAAEVEKQMPIVRHAELNAYLERVGRRLASQPEADSYPYTFKLVQDKSVNAFALPGGPTFVNTGLLLAAENEDQLAGVMAHEIAHVALRHGTNQASKAQLIQLPALLAGIFVGDGSLSAQLAQIGIGLGANSVLLKFSRNAERDADLLGARMMSRAGYNPIEMARFFEKLEAEAGKGNWLTNFLSSHPNPGNRTKTVEEEIRYLPQRSYDAASGDLPRMKNAVEDLPELPKARRQPGPAGGGNQNPAAARPSGGFREFRGREVAFLYPDNWEVFGDSRNEDVTIAPRAAIFGQQIGYGIIARFHESRRGDLRRDTQELIRQLQSENPGMRAVSSGSSRRINGYRAIVTRLESRSPYQGAREIDTLVTIDRPGGIYYLVLIAPETEYPGVDRAFDQVLRSLRFAN